MFRRSQKCSEDRSWPVSHPNVEESGWGLTDCDGIDTGLQVTQNCQMSSKLIFGGACVGALGGWVIFSKAITAAIWD